MLSTPQAPNHAVPDCPLHEGLLRWGLPKARPAAAPRRWGWWGLSRGTSSYGGLLWSGLLVSSLCHPEAALGYQARSELHPSRAGCWV